MSQFEQVMKEHAALLERTVSSIWRRFNSLRKVMERQDADNIALRVLWETTEDYDPDKGAFEPWLKTKLYQEFKDQMRHINSQKRDPGRLQDVDVNQLKSFDPDPAEAMDAAAVLKRLTPTERKALELEFKVTDSKGLNMLKTSWGKSALKTALEKIKQK